MISIPPAVIAARITDPERLVEGVRGADLQPCQLSRGAALSELARVHFPRSCLDMVRLGPVMLFTGAMPRDCYTILFVLACPQPGHSFNFEMEHTDGYVASWAPGGTLDAITPAGYRNATLTLPAPEFEAGLAAHFPDAPEKLLATSAAMWVKRAAQHQIRSVARAVWKMVWDPAQPLAAPTVLRHTERAVRAAFFATLRAGCEHLLPPAPLRIAGRHRRLRQAREYLAAHAREPLYLEDLCTALTLSPRAVENLFQDFLSLSPTAYLRHQRLHGVRRALQHTAPAPGAVKHAALEWGFLHHGHFARDYRALFGESPSATLTGWQANGASKFQGMNGCLVRG